MAKPRKGNRPKYRKKTLNEPAHFQASIESNAVKQVQRTAEVCNAHQLAEQDRAKYALIQLKACIKQFESVEGAESQSRLNSSELKANIRKLPAMIQMNGFGQAMAFYYAKGEVGKSTDNNTTSSCVNIGELNSHGAIYTMIQDWLCSEKQVYSLYASRGNSRLMIAITESCQFDYRSAQAETNALMRWVKKFAEALIQKTGEKI